MAEKRNEVIDTYIKGSLPKLDDEDFWNVDDGEYTAHINDKYRIKICQNEQSAWKYFLLMRTIIFLKMLFLAASIRRKKLMLIQIIYGSIRVLRRSGLKGFLI